MMMQTYDYDNRISHFLSGEIAQVAKMLDISRLITEFYNNHFIIGYNYFSNIYIKYLDMTEL